MKKLILLAIVLVPAISFGATIVLKELNYWDSFAMIKTEDQRNVRIYRVEDGLNTCYISHSVSNLNSGSQTGISCLKN